MQKRKRYRNISNKASIPEIAQNLNNDKRLNFQNYMRFYLQ